MSSIMRRVWQRFMKPTYLVGRDLEGNKYYEYSNANGGRSKRTVQYKQTDDMWTYIASGKRLPVQWNAWLTHTRSNPPSIDELRNDLARRHRVQMNAAILEARDKEERLARLAEPPGTQVPEPRLETKVEQRPVELPVNTSSDSSHMPARDPWAEAQKDPGEPQPWKPVIRQR